jgi:uncharacterized protein (DUF1015 family)
MEILKEKEAWEVQAYVKGKYYNLTERRCKEGGNLDGTGSR